MRSSRYFVNVLIATSFAVASCGDAATNSDDTGPDGSFGTTTTVLEKPSVEIPAEIPTELVVTDLVTGSGPAAEVGDDLLVHYVGVLSADGQEFDNNYDAV